MVLTFFPSLRAISCRLPKIPKMKIRHNFTTLLLILAAILHGAYSNSASSVCELKARGGKKLYHFNLASPISGYPHGVLSEDGFYKIAVNGTMLWFQICDGMIFNHDPPRCVGCEDCGGSSRCGMGCSAVVSNQVRGYHVCTAIGRFSGSDISLIDEKNPSMGVVVKMSSASLLTNCTLSVSVFCDSNGLQGPNSLEKSGSCDYATVLRHPSGCAKIISHKGSGWGWFSTVLIIVLCLFGGYMIGGAVYRYVFLGVRGVHVIPNLEVWSSLPHRIQGLFRSLMRRFRGPSEGHRSTYSPVNF